MTPVTNIDTRVLPIGIEDSAGAVRNGEESEKYSDYIYIAAPAALGVGILSTGAGILGVALSTSKVAFGIFGGVGLVELGLGIKSLRLVVLKTMPITKTDYYLACIGAVLAGASAVTAIVCADSYI